MHEYSKRIGEHIKSCYSDFNKMTREDLDELKEWACVMKDLTEYDINKRGIEAMDEAEQEEKMYGRMGYDRYRYSNGRFAPKGRGKRMGYMPYLHMMSDDMEDYGPYDDMPYPMTGYRMGYTTGNDRMDGMETRRPSRYGESYDRYSDRRRHYHETKDADSKKQMDDSMKEYMSDVSENLREMWKDADPTLRQTMKADLTKMVQQLQ